MRNLIITSNVISTALSGKFLRVCRGRFGDLNNAKALTTTS